MSGWITRLDTLFAGGALLLMLCLPLLETLLRPLFGFGVNNAPVLVQHLGLILAMAGAVVAERGGHLTSLAGGLSSDARRWAWAEVFWRSSSALISGMLAWASWQFVSSEMAAPQPIAYGIPAWGFQVAMPFGFAVLGVKIALRMAPGSMHGRIAACIVPLAGAFLASVVDGSQWPLWPFAVWLLLILLAGAPVFAVLGGGALLLFASEGQPLASIPLSHYQITVNPSLPALPLFTLAGLVFARTGAAARLSRLFIAVFGHGARGTAIAGALLCSGFTALTGGSGVTILALGGLLLPLLTHSGFPERKGIGLVTSASALGVLLAPSVPLIMFAIIARVPINTMFLAGLLPALVMVACLLLMGGFLKGPKAPMATVTEILPLAETLRAALWELLAPVVAIGALVSGLATPTEGAALTAAYALLTQGVLRRELTLRMTWALCVECAQIIGGIMLILGMALGLTNYLIDAAIPDQAIEWVQSILPERWSFIIALNIFLLIAGALMEIYAAIVVLVPLLLPVAQAYGIDPVHFGVIFLANIEMGFLCPPAGMNLYFASAMFDKPLREVAQAVLPAVLAMFCGAVLISALPWLATALPQMLLGGVR